LALILFILVIMNNVPFFFGCRNYTWRGHILLMLVNEIVVSGLVLGLFKKLLYRLLEFICQLFI